ncbi:vacuolar iron transporter homolog 5 [Elaeis guineensis]|uniref:Vacuolar iron transporter n=1 Tax=Elaeis guineensis var. tenera TaxID=51953 RepID=A0A6J0PND4_ELAGV|nr:vacuolar iron transporter homolog 2.1 [Elaeis guineensis]
MKAAELANGRSERKLSVPDEPHGGDEKETRAQRAQWLRAAVLGANDGLLSTASLMLGVGSAKEDRRSMIVSGAAGAVAGAFSMTVGEFVSVSMQRDIEMEGRKTKSVEQTAMASAIKNFTPPPPPPPSPAILAAASPPLALSGLSAGRSPMMRAIAAARSREVGKGDDGEPLPSPIKAAAASGLAFMAGSLVPFLSSAFISHHWIRLLVLAIVTSVALAAFGGLGAYLGGSQVRTSAMRVLIGGWVAMGVTYLLLKPLGKDHKDG